VILLAHQGKSNLEIAKHDPAFGPKAADIVGVYLNPPENALVLCVDEKPSIQARINREERKRSDLQPV
jgi:hypothetical protein